MDPGGPVFLFQPVLPHYRIPVFARLDRALEGRLVVIFGQPPGVWKDRVPDELPFAHLRVRNRWLPGEFLVQPIWKAFRRFGRPRVVVSGQGPRVLSLFPLLAWARARGVPVVLRGHGGSRRRSVATSGHPADRLHRWIIRRADAFVCYTDPSRDELARFADPEKLFVARNTLDTDRLFPLRRALEEEGREAVRARLGLTDHRRWLLFIGRLNRVKRPDLFLETLAVLREVRGAPVGGVVVGDGPLRGSLEARARELGLEDVRFTGAILEETASGGYLFAADALLLPGAVGLSVNHALSFGLPVVTTRQGPEGPFHHPEVAYVEPGVTGAFARALEPGSLATAVEEVLEAGEALRASAVAYAEEHLTVDRMVEGHLRAVEHALETGART